MNTASKRKLIRDMNLTELLNLAKSIQHSIDEGMASHDDYNDLSEIKIQYKQITGNLLTLATARRGA